ncbi:MAG: hypothetical protein M3071_04225 [Actinomycetota bacterium]|nr:hypothetical protein [Actinomycetota bacterium]
MSFFDETDEPPPVRRVRRPAGTGRRPPSEQQVIMVRRGVALVAILVVVIVLAVGVHSCQVSSRNSALRAYNTNVASLIRQSDATGRSVFSDLSSAPKSASAGTVQTLTSELDSASHTAATQLSAAQSLSPPSEVSTAQQNLVLTLSLRRSGIADIASHIQEALSKSTAQQGVNAIAVDMQEFLASDVVYTTQTAQEIAAALHGAAIPVGGVNGETIQATSYLPDLAWLTISYIAKQLNATLPSSSSSSSSSSASGTCPSICGHKLNTVSVGGVALSTGGGNTIPASPPPVLTANFTNTGQNTETGVTVQATVTTTSGTTITGKAVQPTTSPGQTYNVQIPLPHAPPTGSAQVVVMVERVAGETSVVRNTMTFPVTFD